MQLLVTGSSGQIGSYVVDIARERGHSTVGIDLEPDEDAMRTDLAGDIRDAELVHQAMEGIDAVVHCAAQISVQASLEDPREDATHNVLGTINLLEAARRYEIAGRFVNVSSAAVYGDPDELPIDETHATRPLAPYGQSKLAAEGYTRLFGRTHGLDAISVRPFNVYSPRQDPSNPYSGVISVFADRVKQGKAPIVHGDGEQTRDFVHAEDVARWMVEIAEAERLPAGWDVVNLGTGQAVSVNTLTETFLRLAELDLEPEHDDPREGDIRRSVADTTRMEKLGLAPTVRLRDGLAGMLG